MQRFVASLACQRKPIQVRTGLVLKFSHRGADKLAGERAPVVCPGYQGGFQHQFVVSERAHCQTIPRNAPRTNLG